MKPISTVVVRSVDWMSGSCTCSPQPHETSGLKPASGSDEVGMVTITCVLPSDAEDALAAAEPDADPVPCPAQPAKAPAKGRTAAPAPSAFTNVRRERLEKPFDSMPMGKLLSKRRQDDEAVSAADLLISSSVLRFFIL